MTYEEAIKLLNSVTIYYGGKCSRTALDLAIEALEKQIPRKPIIREAEDYFGNVKHTLCPNCQETEFVFTQPCFCHHCGQALDWEVN